MVFSPWSRKAACGRETLDHRIGNRPLQTGAVVSGPCLVWATMGNKQEKTEQRGREDPAFKISFVQSRKNLKMCLFKNF